MERTTFCLLFYIRRTKLNRNGEAPIMMRITVNGVRVDASVKKTILPEFWSAAKGKALEKKREYKELNLYLDSIRLRIMKIQRELEIEEVSVSANSVLDRFLGKDAPYNVLCLRFSVSIMINVSNCPVRTWRLQPCSVMRHP